MIGNFLKRFLWLILVLALQVLVLNHVHILGYATPMVSTYFILLFPQNSARVEVLLWGFALGLFQDIFSNTAGMCASSLTLAALLQPVLLKAFSPRDTEEEEEALVPSAQTMNWGPFLRYVFVAVFIQQIAFYLLEAFSFFNLVDLSIHIGGGTLISFLIILAIEGVRKGKETDSRQ